MEENNNQQASYNILNQNKQDFTKNDGVNNGVKKMKACKIRSIIGLILGLIPIVLFIYCLIVSVGDTSESGEGTVFWLLIIYGWTLAIPFAIISVINSVTAIKINKNPLSITSLVISLITALAIAVILIIIYVPNAIQNHLPNSDTNYIVHSSKNPSISISFPTIGDRKLNCGDNENENVVFCSNDNITIEGINRIGSYIEKANSTYEMHANNKNSIFKSIEKINCIDDAICYVYDIDDSFSNKDQIRLTIFSKAEKYDDYFEISYTFDKSDREKYINKILKETHIVYE